MNDLAKRAGWAVALGLAVAGQVAADDPPPASRFPTLPAEHVHARMLLDNAMRYAGPASKMVDPVSGYPFEGWNQDPKRGLYLRSFTQLTAIGQWMELLADVAAGFADAPGLGRDQALDQLARLVKTLRDDQRDPKLAADGLLGNFLDLATGKRLGPLASNVEKSRIHDAFGPSRGEAIWKALKEAGWIAPRRDDQEADIVRGAKYGYEYFEGPLAPFKDEATRQKLLAILDARVVMLIFGDNSNLTASAAKTIGALLVPDIKDDPRAVALRGELESFLDTQQAGYAKLYDAKGGLFYFGRDATRGRLFGWDDLQGNRTIGHMDYLVNEFRGPSTFVAVRFGLPAAAIRNLGFKMKPYRASDGRDLYTLAPWEGSAFQALGLGLTLGEANRPSWRKLLENMVAIEVDFAGKHHLPGFLSESYTGDGTQYTGSVGIPEITVSPRPRIVDAASLYTLGAAYSVAPGQVERFLATNWPRISTLLTDHGPWEGINVAKNQPIEFQTTAHTLALTLGLIGQGSDNMLRYVESKGLSPGLEAYFAIGEGADLLGKSPAFAWTAKGDALDSGKGPTGFRVKGDALKQFGAAFVPAEPDGVDLSGGMLTLRYRSASAIDPVSIDLKPARPEADDPGLIPRSIAVRFAATGPDEAEIQVPLPATPGLSKVKEVVIFHERAEKGPIDLTITHFSITPIGPR